MHYLKYNTASQEVPIGVFVDETDGKTAETGLTIANTDIKLWKAGATTLENKNSGGATHISGGIYYAVLDATDTGTLGPMTAYVHVAGALPCKVDTCVLPAQVYDSIIAGTDLLQVDTTQLNGTAQTARDIGASVLLSSGSGTGQVTITSGRVNADVTHIATAAVSTSTAQLGVNVVNAAGTAWGSGAITAASLAADAGAEIADAVWDEALAGHATGGSAGAGLTSASSAGDPWGTAVPGAYGAGTAGNILGNRLVGTIATGTHTAQTGDSYARIGANGSGLTGITGVTLAATQSGVTIPTVTTLTNLPAVTSNWLTAAGIADGAIDAAALAADVWARLGIVAYGTAQAATGTTLQLASSSAFANDELNGSVIVITGGTTGVGQSRLITGYVGSTDTATVDTWTTTPTGTITYVVFAAAPASSTVVPAVNVTQFGGSAGTFSGGRPEVNTTHAAGTAWGSGAITAGSIAADAIGASELAADAASEIGTAVWATATRQLTGTQTFNVTGTITGNLSGSVGSVTGAVGSVGAGGITAASIATGAIDADALAADAVDEILDEVVEGTITMRQALRAILAVLAGKVSGAGTSTVTFRDTGDTTDRIVAAVDGSGNRTTVTRTLT